MSRGTGQALGLYERRSVSIPRWRRGCPRVPAAIDASVITRPYDAGDVGVFTSSSTMPRRLRSVTKSAARQSKTPRWR